MSDLPKHGRLTFFEGEHFEVMGKIEMANECKKYSVDLSAYFDGELEGEELQDMESHLSSCLKCRTSLAKMKKLHNALSTLGQTPAHRRSVLDDLKAKLALDTDEEPDKTPLPS